MLFNNAGQVWNHNFLWQCLKPGGGGQPPNPISDLINSSFGSFEAFREQFNNAGLSTFGSGWVWLVFDRQNNNLRILQTKDGDTPIAGEQFIPILTMVSKPHSRF
jgi:Fe-Mn family superoxide dismutase